MKKKARKTPKKEEIAEDWCFVCKDGGLLLVCDYKQCLKAYHPGCVGKDDSFLETGTRWTCNWHSCFVCRRSSHFYCYCCPKAVCKHCIHGAEFVNVRGKKGFCSHCLKIALLVEEKKDVDSDGGEVDFKDRETYEGLFMEYWALINEKEGLTIENLQSANVRLKMGKNYKSDSESDEQDISEEDQLISDSDNMDYMEEHKPERKRKRRSVGQSSPGKRRYKSNKEEFTGWGSKSLVQFLSSIGKDTSGKLSQHDVSSIVNGYIKENNLFHPEKKKLVVCDSRLRSVLGRKMVNKNRIFGLLDTHFAENLDSSEEDDVGYNSEEIDADILVSCKRRRKSSTERVSLKKEVVFNIPDNCLASLVAENIKLIYLKKSLVKELLQQPETFESKVLRSFVRVKSDPNDFLQKNPYQLVQVTGIKKSSSGEIDTEILLQVSAMPKDFHISALSDDDFSEEECEDLRMKVELGLLKKLTVNELEQKARSLHEDQTKHWIARELILLQNLIDRANEKGWRRELYEHMERKQLLNTSAEQLRLLKEVPTVIPHVEELETISEDVKDDNKHGEEGTPRSILVSSSEILGDNWGRNGTFSVADEKNHRGQVSVPKEKQQLTEVSALSKPPQQTPILSSKAQLNLLEIEHHRSLSEENQICLKPFTFAPKDQSNNNLQSTQNRESLSLSSTKQTEPTDFEKAKGKDPSKVQLIELSSDDEDDNDDGAHAAIGIEKPEDQESSIWYCSGPNGEKIGPHSLSLLKRWSKYSSFALKFKVWKTTQSEENAISLGDAVNRAFPGK